VPPPQKAGPPLYPPQVGLVFPRADRPIAVEFPSYPVVRLRPILLELAGRGGSVPPLKRRDPPYPPSLVVRKGTPPWTPLGFQKVPFRRVCPTSWASPNDANSGWNSANRGVSCRNGPASGHLDIGGGQGGLCGFYREIAGVGLVFPRADRPIAVEFPGYPVVRFRPILLELAGRGVACPPQKAGPPLYPPLIGDPKSYPPRGPPLEL
jgi:hypothetical protein